MMFMKWEEFAQNMNKKNQVKLCILVVQTAVLLDMVHIHYYVKTNRKLIFPHCFFCRSNNETN